MNKDIFSKKHFLKALKEAGLPCTYPTLIKFENKGIIDKPKQMQSMNKHEWRFYTEDEMEKNIKKLRLYYRKTNNKI